MALEHRSANWHWWVSGLLLLATMINYMDRQTLSNLSVRITNQFQLTQEQYGDLELVFGVAFAVGSLFFGSLADRVSVRWLYPSVLLAWSAVGFATGLTQGYRSLLVCRALLGFFESGHWPCALIVTQTILARSKRVMGNSILQSGASLGAVLTPLVIWIFLYKSPQGGDSPGVEAWRMPFFAIGSVGVLWVIGWLTVVRPGDLQVAVVDRKGGERAGWMLILQDRRFWALAMMLVAINTSWQLIRAWLPKFLQEGRGYSETAALYFNSAYFIATDVGCIAAGFATLWLVARGWRVHSSRLAVYFIGALLAGLTTLAAFQPAGWPLLVTLLLIGAGTLSVFPCYYSFSQDVSQSHMGRVTGALAFIGWIIPASMQKLFGRVVDQTGSYDFNLAILGWAPMIGLGLFILLWPQGDGALDAGEDKRVGS